MFKVGMLFSTGFLTYVESKIVVTLLVLIVVGSLALGAYNICLRRKLTELQIVQSAGSDVSDVGKFTSILVCYSYINSFIRSLVKFIKQTSSQMLYLSW